MMSGEFDLSEEEGCEESDLCRGYGDLSSDLDKLYIGGGSYDPDSIVGAADGSKPNATEDDFAPEMPVDFYQSVEVFLSKAPPRLSDCVSKAPKVTSKKQDKGSDVQGLMFPRLVPPTRIRSDEATPPEPPLKASKVKSKIYSDAKKGSKAQVHIDHHLLQEAFAYTEMLIKNAMEEETAENGAVGIARDTATQHKTGSSNAANKPSDKTKSVSAPPNHHHEGSSFVLESAYGDGRPPLRKHVGHTGSNHKSGAAVGVVKKLRSRSQASTITATAAAFDADNHSSRSEAFRVAVEVEVDPRRNAVDFDDLVANFQDGITLHQLRRDLEESKRSMKRSEDFLRQLSKDFLHGVTH